MGFVLKYEIGENKDITLTPPILKGIKYNIDLIPDIKPPYEPLYPLL